MSLRKLAYLSNLSTLTVPRYFETSEISTRNAIDLGTLFAEPQESRHLYIAYLDNTYQLWHIVKLFFWKRDGNQPWIPSDYNYGNAVILLSEDNSYTAIGVDVTLRRPYNSGEYETTLYLPCALFEDLTPENANHDKIEKVTWEFFATSQLLKSVNQINFYGDNCHLWSVSDGRVVPYC